VLEGVWKSRCGQHQLNQLNDLPKVGEAQPGTESKSNQDNKGRSYQVLIAVVVAIVEPHCGHYFNFRVDSPEQRLSA
jgi:hypothetical protein